MRRITAAPLAAFLLILAPFTAALAQGPPADPAALNAAAESLAGAAANAADPGPDVGVGGRVVMKDGSIVLGEVLGLEDGKLRVKAAMAAAGEVELAWAEVAQLETNAAVLFWLEDDEERNGQMLPGAEEGQLLVLLVGKSVPRTFPIASLLSINPAPQDTIFYTGEIHLGLSAAQGNTETVSLTTRIRLGVEAGPHLAGLRYTSNYGEDNETVSARNQRLGLEYDYFLTRRLFLAAQGSAETDAFQDLDLRTIYSAGLGWAFVRAGDLESPWLEDLAIKTSLGPAYLNEKRKDAVSRDFVAGRWTLNVDWGIYPGVKLFHEHEGLVSVEDAEEVLVNSGQGLRLALPGGLAATFRVDWNWNNTPSPGLERSDLIYLTTLGWAFSL